jgi:hypothetical protein
VKVRNEKSPYVMEMRHREGDRRNNRTPTWCCSTLTVMTRHTAGSTID